MQEPLNKNDIIEKIARRLKCSTCGRRYRPYDFQVMEERENLAVMRIVCRDCRKQSVVLAIVQRHKVRSVVSELEPDEWQRFRDLKPVTRDEVIRIHRLMHVYDGDFTDVLEDPLPPEVLESGD
jgi:ribosomal protein S27E